MPLALHLVVRPKTVIGALAERFTNVLLLAPVFGAFFQTLFTHRVPSLAWGVLLLFAAAATRLLKTQVREHMALLGHDGVLVADRFVAVQELAAIERDDDTLWVTTHAGERLELRGTAEDMARAKPLVEELREAIARPAPALGLLGGVDAEALEAAGGVAYRGLPLDPGVCLAVAEDVSAPPAARVAAAKLVARDADPAVRIRIGAIAESTVNPALREVLLDPSEPRSSTRGS